MAKQNKLFLNKYGLFDTQNFSKQEAGLMKRINNERNSWSWKGWEPLCPPLPIPTLGLQCGNELPGRGVEWTASHLPPFRSHHWFAEQQVGMEAEGPATQTWVVLEGEELEVNRGLGAKASSSWMGSAVTHESCREGRFSFIQSFIQWLHTRLKIEVAAYTVLLPYRTGDSWEKRKRLIPCAGARKVHIKPGTFSFVPVSKQTNRWCQEDTRTSLMGI